MPTVPTSPSTRIHSWSLVKRIMSVLPRASCRPVIAMGHEGQRRDAGGPRLAAKEEPKRRARSGERRLDIAHRDRAPDARPEAARGHAADRAARSVRDVRALTGRGAAFRQDADAAPARAVAKLGE